MRLNVSTAELKGRIGRGLIGRKLHFGHCSRSFWPLSEGQSRFVEVCYLSTDGETEACARGFCSKERLKDSCLQCGIDTRSLVEDSDYGARVFSRRHGGRLDCNRATVRHCIECVHQEIDKELDELTLVSQNQRQISVTPEKDRGLTFLQGGTMDRNDVAQKWPQRDWRKSSIFTWCHLP